MKHAILGIPFDLIDYQSAMEQIDWWRRSAYRGYVTLTNAHGVMLSRRDREVEQALQRADLALPDGISITLAARLFGCPHRGRVTGPALMLRLCQRGRDRGYRHFFYGGAEGVAHRLAEKLQRRFPGLQVAGAFCPPFRELRAEEDEQVVQKINDTRPDVVWVGLGAPKQEKWMARHAKRISAAAMIGVGAAFDFHSGNARWAPAWIRTAGLEWAYRLMLNPRRMWRRNLGNLLFGMNVVGHSFWRAVGLGPVSPTIAATAAVGALSFSPNITGAERSWQEKHEESIGGVRNAA